MADTAYQRAKSLLDYVTADTPKYGPSASDMSSGPGGAAAMNMKMSRQGKSVRDMGTQMQQMRAIDQMQTVSKLYRGAAQTLKANKKKYKDI